MTRLSGLGTSVWSSTAVSYLCLPLPFPGPCSHPGHLGLRSSLSPFSWSDLTRSKSCTHTVRVGDEGTAGGCSKGHKVSLFMNKKAWQKRGPRDFSVEKNGEDWSWEWERITTGEALELSCPQEAWPHCYGNPTLVGSPTWTEDHDLTLPSLPRALFPLK